MSRVPAQQTACLRQQRYLQVHVIQKIESLESGQDVGTGNVASVGLKRDASAADVRRRDWVVLARNVAIAGVAAVAEVLTSEVRDTPT